MRKRSVIALYFLEIDTLSQRMRQIELIKSLKICLIHILKIYGGHSQERQAQSPEDSTDRERPGHN